MTNPVNSDAARAPRAAEAGQPDASQQRTRIVRERLLAALEAQLARDLHPSPPIAAEHGDENVSHRTEEALHPAPVARQRTANGKPAAARPPRRIVRRQGPAFRRDAAPENAAGPVEPVDGKRMQDLLRELRRLSAESEYAQDARQGRQARGNSVPAPVAHLHDDSIAPSPVDLDERHGRELPGWPEPVREPEMPRVSEFQSQYAALSEPAWVKPPSPFARAMRLTAATFSVVALVGASAAVVLLAIGGDAPVQQAATAPSALSRDAAGAQNDAVPRARDEAPVVTASIGSKRDTSRIPTDAAAALRGSGMVRPAEEAPKETPRETPKEANMGGPYVAAPSVETPPARGSIVEPRASAPREPEPVRFSAPPSYPARTETAAASSAGTEPARAMPSAAVTQHVNMRAEPKNEAAVVMIVPEGKTVELVDCGQWCEVVYDGRKGFIHKRFVAGQ